MLPFVGKKLHFQVRSAGMAGIGLRVPRGVAVLLAAALSVVAQVVDCAKGSGAVNFASAVNDGAADGAIRIVDGHQNGALAWASFENGISATGWSYLEVRTNPRLADEQTAYAAGALEAWLTRPLIGAHAANLLSTYCEGGNRVYCDRLREFLADQLAWLNAKASRERIESPFWNLVYLLLKQLAGLDDVYANRTILLPQRLYDKVTDLFILNNFGSLMDLENALHRKHDNGSLSLTTPCSMLLKKTETDFLVGHNTWTTYKAMIRIQKKYVMPFRLLQENYTDIRVPGASISMSSYPATLDSVDDFYVTSAGLVVSETTNDIYNKTLYNFIRRESVPTSFRAMIANRLAEDGRRWTRQFAKHNSGLYNNQWVVIDYKKVKASMKQKSLQNGTFWMIEQLPTLMQSRDMTNVLNSQGYWASYNVPYFANIYKESGFMDLFLKNGSRYSHTQCPRAQIFNRDQFRVQDVGTMLSILRYNDYQNDPLSTCNCTPAHVPVYTIAARYDLVDASGRYVDPDITRRPEGAIDAKVADLRSSLDLSFVAVAGPTSDHQPAFSWSSSGFNYSMRMQPDRFDFKPVRHTWSL